VSCVSRLQFSNFDYANILTVINVEIACRPNTCLSEPSTKFVNYWGIVLSNIVDRSLLSIFRSITLSS